MPDIPLPKPQPPAPSSTITPPPNPNQSNSSSLPKPPIPSPAQPPTATPAPAGPPKPATPPPAPSSGGGLPTPPRPPAPAGMPPASGGGQPPTNQVKQENPSASAENKPQMATAGNPIKKFLPFIIGGVVLLLIAVGAFAFFSSRQNTVSVNPSVTTGDNANTAKTNTDTSRQTVTDKKVQLTYWGLWETNEVLEEAFADFEAQNPGVDIVYQKQSHVDYRQRLQTAIASGNGPDLFRYHASWVPMMSTELSAMPSKVMSTDVYQKTFYPVASQLLQSNGQIVGIPLMYDGIALYYNKEVLETAGEQPPQTWTDLKTLASKLTIRSGSEIKRAGLAIGNASTTEHFPDIIALLMFQNGADPKDLTTKEAQEALIFYTNFVTKDKVWDDKLPTSTVAFARGDAAMMLAPSWRAHEVLEINPNLDFGIVSVPTLGSQKIALASFWAEGVSSKSKNKDMAWELLKYLSTKEVMQKLYSEQAQTRAFGEIYSRVDLADTLASDPYVAPFLADAPYAKGWYLNSYTHDKGLNDNLIKYYQDAVNALVQGTSIEKVMETLSLGSQQILRQYNIK